MSGLVGCEITKLLLAEGVKVTAVTRDQSHADLPDFAEESAAVEEAVSVSSLRWTFLRSVDFAADTPAWASPFHTAGSCGVPTAIRATSPIHEHYLAKPRPASANSPNPAEPQLGKTGMAASALT